MKPVGSSWTGRIAAGGVWLLSAASAGASGARAPEPPAGGPVLDRFVYSSAAAARQAWKAVGDGTPPVEPIPGGGLAFPCPFQSARLDRCYWDRAVSLDLSQATSLQLELSVDRPEALRSLLVYLESDGGWYVWGGPLAQPGRQRLTLTKKDFQTEGRPAGWNRIRRVRISPYAGAPGDARLILYSFAARADAVLLIRGVQSVSDPAERRFAAGIADRLHGWLADLDIPHGLLDDGDVTDTALARASVAILGYNPVPTAAEYAALERFVRRGGKLIVCYSDDSRLARLLGMKLGAYRKADAPGQWSGFAFDRPREWHAPPRVRQCSGNIRPALPDSPDARVIAWWEDAAGRRTADPAWTASPQGAWMAHVPLADDPPAMAHLFAGLLVRFAPSLGPAVAQRVLRQAGRIDSFSGFDAAFSALRGLARGDAPATALLDRAAAGHEAMVRANEAGAYGDVLDTARDVREALTEAFARVQQPRPGERRGVWDHDALGWYPGNWARTCRELKAGGFTDIFINALWAGVAHYPSAIVPRSGSVARYGDQLDACVRAAHAQGLKVHLWVVCWNLDTAPPDRVAALRSAGRLQQDSGGATRLWLNPAVAANRDELLAALREAVQRYPMDGVHLDYIRWPDGQSCFSPATRAAFERADGRPVNRWPADVRGAGARAAAFDAWRQTVITDVVRRVHDELRPLRPGLELSAAVWANYPDIRESIGQDWPLWLQRGYLDFVCPMNYTENLAEFSSRAARQLALPGAAGRIWPGIGMSSGESQLRADQVIEQIRAARRAGAPGFCVFQLDDRLRSEVLPLLKLGLTRP